jgi:hypothetical protein
LDTMTQPVLGKFPIKVKISMTISNSVPRDWNYRNTLLLISGYYPFKAWLPMT